MPPAIETTTIFGRWRLQTASLAGSQAGFAMVEGEGDQRSGTMLLPAMLSCIGHWLRLLCGDAGAIRDEARRRHCLARRRIAHMEGRLAALRVYAESLEDVATCGQSASARYVATQAAMGKPEQT